MSSKSKKTKSDAAVDDLSFEAALEELEGIVARLEAGDLALEAALGLFERGQALAGRCGQLLETAELKVQALRPRAGGHTLEPFEAED